MQGEVGEALFLLLWRRVSGEASNFPLLTENSVWAYGSSPGQIFC